MVHLPSYWHVAVVMVLGVLSGASCTPITVSKDNSWDYLLFVARWAGSAGYQTTLPRNVTSFTLHGMWPTRNDGSWPQFCNSSYPFDPKQIADLVPILDEVWFDYQGNGFDFWSHEWEKHGTCAVSDSQLSDEHAFFTQAIKLHQALNLKGALDNAGITPSSSQTYSTDQILDAFRSSLGEEVLLSCEQLKPLGKAIFRVEACISKTLQVIKCPKSTVPTLSACSGALYYPPIQY